jgi:hypothetical protein
MRVRWERDRQDRWDSGRGSGCRFLPGAFAARRAWDGG